MEKSEKPQVFPLFLFFVFFRPFSHWILVAVNLLVVIYKMIMYNIPYRGIQKESK